MAATAQRITVGEQVDRLEPDRTDTELGRLATAFDDMVDAQAAALQSAEEEREGTRRFLADAAHQLRTPMAGLRASVEQLLQERDPQMRDRLVGNIVRETARASRLVTGLLRMARLEREQARRVPTDVVEICEHEVERARSLAPHLHIELADAPVIGRIQADPEAVQEAIANLLDNARRHAETWVQLRLTADDRMLTVQVRDDGPGIRPQDVERIFERFASLDGRGGSGLGLPIARGVAQAHGGDLTYDGHAFVLRLPRAAAA